MTIQPVALLAAFAFVASPALGSPAIALGGGPPLQASEREKLFDPSRDAAKDIQVGIKQAAKEHKRVLIDVGGDWCIWCHKLDSTFKTDAVIAAALRKNFVVVKVNYSQDNENKAVLSKYPKIDSYPHLFILDTRGKCLWSEDTGLLETGDHHDHDKVMAFLKKWAN